MPEPLIFLLFVATPVFAFLWWSQRNELLKTRSELKSSRMASSQHQAEAKRLKERYAPVINMDAYVEKGRAERQRINAEIERLQASYKEKRQVYDSLLEQIAIYDETVSFAQFGVYEPHFDFGDSESYKDEIKVVREEQKAAVKDKLAIFTHTEWEVEGSRSKGRTMANRAVRLTLRAFNGEADAAIANARWNNVNAMVKRIENACKQIDKANASLRIEISDYYLNLKLKELKLTHEYREQLKIERDERAEERRIEREESRLEQEAAQALAEEQEYEALLERAREESGVTHSEEQQERIAELERQLAEAHEKTERAKAMAEQTKSGFVYIISNIGSFGDGIVKIGLTRRLDPTDRVRELGDASVPFRFDAHAMIYSDEAPALEAALHARFAEHRINAANMRKEFFRVDLKDVEEALLELAPEAEFHKDIEAQEFRETMARRQQKLEAEEAARELVFPDAI